ncbi:MAG: hypothetical protein IRY94_08990 [Rhodospirillaceae bacterium]|nr:hypothetical protein [Rhodospirillaceae bacterium]
MRALHLVFLMLLCGCARFDSWLQPEKTAAGASMPSAWARTGTSEDQTAADLESCRSQAGAVVARDRQIDTDIGSIDREYGDAPTLRAQMDEFGYQRRFEITVHDCMRKLGYGEARPPAPGATAPSGGGQPEAPPAQ